MDIERYDGPGPEEQQKQENREQGVGWGCRTIEQLKKDIAQFEATLATLEDSDNEIVKQIKRLSNDWDSDKIVVDGKSANTCLSLNGTKVMIKHHLDAMRVELSERLNAV
jgi:hypothetical protein